VNDTFFLEGTVDEYAVLILEWKSTERGPFKIEMGERGGLQMQGGTYTRIMLKGWKAEEEGR
jgi:hypothetical protein